MAINDLPFAAVQPDWSQNDENAADYVKNRTHYVKSVEEIAILPETTITPDEDGVYNITEPLFSPVVAGTNYTVIYNGVRYELPAKELSIEGISILYIGNSVSLPGGEDTGEPFIFAPTPAGMESDSYASCMVFDGAENVTIEITTINEIVKTIDPKYLADGNGRHKYLTTDENGNAKWEQMLTWAETSVVEVLPETEFTFDDSGESGITDPIARHPADGNVCVVTFDGVEYETVATEFKEGGFTVIVLGNMSVVGGEDTGEPFAVMIPSKEASEILGGITVMVQAMHDGVSSATISIKENIKVYRKISSELLPTPDWEAQEGEEGYIANKTHWIEKDAVIIQPTVFSIDSARIETPFSPLVEGGEYSITFNETEYKCIAQRLTSNGLTALALGNLPKLMETGDSGEPFLFIEMPPELVADSGYGQISVFDDSITEFIFSIKASAIVHKLDSKYIHTPDWNAFKGENGYIANRTHYINLTDKEILAETTFTGLAEGLVPVGASLLEEIEVGMEYTVTWNGVDYVCVGKVSQNEFFEGFFDVILGNPGSFDAQNQTEEPFMFGVLSAGGSSMVHAKFAISSYDGSTQATMKISLPAGAVHKIDPMYLPDITGFVSSVNGKTDEVTLTAEDVGADAIGTAQAKIDELYIQNYNLSLKTQWAAENDSNYSIGYEAVALGRDSKASGIHSYAEGADTTASGARSHAEGNNTFASGEDSHAEGMNNVLHQIMLNGEANSVEYICDSNYALVGRHVLNNLNNTTACIIAVNTNSDGQKTITLDKTLSNEALVNHAVYIFRGAASGKSSHAEGSYTLASGIGSHAEGINTIASGDDSHAEGADTIASGLHSHAEGLGTIAASANQHVQGQYNIEGTYAHIVGNGTSTVPSNAHTLDWSGNAWYAGDVLVGGTSQEDAKVLATKEYVDAQMATAGPISSVNGKTGEVVLSASDVGAVPTTRTVNGKVLSNNITLSAADVNAVPTTRTINGKALSSNITLTASDVSAIPTTRKVNGKMLSSDITLSAGDVGALPDTTVIPSIEGLATETYVNEQISNSVPPITEPHKQFVTDADGNAKWEDRTHYTEAVKAEVIPETECINVGGQFGIPGLTTNPALVGVNHRVVYNGVGYDCVGMLFEEDEMSGVALGNTAALGGAMTEHPFFMVIIPAEIAAEEGVCGLVMPLDGVETITVSVEIDGNIAHPLDEKYIPDSVKPANTNLVNGRASGSVRSVNAAEDNADTPLGENAFAFGENAVARGPNSIALGENAHVGDVRGDGNFDDNLDSGVAIGRNAKAGRDGFAFGRDAAAVGFGSFAIGEQSESKGVNTVAIGDRTVAAGRYQTAMGIGNKEDTDERYLLILGNGRDTEYLGLVRSNAYTVDLDGNAWYAGDVYIGGTSQDDGAEMLATESYVDEKVASLVESAPETLNTLNELAAALGDDPNFATTVSNQIGNKVDKTTTVNGKALSSNITLSASDVGALPSTTVIPSTEGLATETYVDEKVAGKVDKTITVNGKALSGNITLSASDVGADAAGTAQAKIDGLYIKNGNNTSLRAQWAAEDNDSYSIGYKAVALGNGSKASGDYSHAEGHSTVASGSHSHAEGYGTIASGNYSHAEGHSTITSGSHSHAEGGQDSTRNITLIGEANSVEYICDSDYVLVGRHVKNSSNGTVACIIAVNTNSEGQKTIILDKTLSTESLANYKGVIYLGAAYGAFSHTEGKGTLANGDYSHAEGNLTIASNYGAHAEGQNTIASGLYSHTEGIGTTASSQSSHAEGTNTNAKGLCSHAEGQSTIASGNYSHVQGKYNIEDTNNKYAHIVGNGTSITTLSNAHTLDWNGNAWYQGNVFVGGASQDDADVLATETYVNEKASTKVDKTTTINGKALSSSIALSANDVNADPSGSANTALANAKSYTDTKISDLINSAPTTLDTLGEIATAMAENEDVVAALEESIGTKANASDLTSHTGNKSNPHGVTLSQLGVTAIATELNYVDGVTSNIQTQLNAKVPTSRTINGKALSSNVTLSASDIGAVPTTTKIGLSGGATGTATTFGNNTNITIPVTDIKESYISWGGQNLLGNLSPFDDIVAGSVTNCFAFLSLNGITAEYTRDGGTTWTPMSATASLFLPTLRGNTLSITKPYTTNDKIRVTIDNSICQQSSNLKKLLFDLYCIGVKAQVIIEHFYNNNLQSTRTFPLSGNWNSIATGYTFYPAYKLRFTFEITDVLEHNNPGFSVEKIVGIGEAISGSNMAKTSELYTYDGNQNAIFPAQISATQFTENGNSLASKYVAQTRTINGKALTSNITLSANDIGALPSTTVIPSIEGLATETYVNEKVAAPRDYIALTDQVTGKIYRLTMENGSLITTLVEGGE